MKIAAITRFKHGALFELLNELGWSQKEFAERSGINVATISSIMRLVLRPNKRQLDGMQKAFGDIGMYVDIVSMFPDSYIGFKRPMKIVQVQDVEPAQLEYFRQNQVQLLEDAQPPVPADAIDTKDKLDKIAKILEGSEGELTDRERNIVRLHLIEGETFEVIGKKYGVTRTRIDVLFRGALQKIRNHFDKDLWKDRKYETIVA